MFNLTTIVFQSIYVIQIDQYIDIFGWILPPQAHWKGYKQRKQYKDRKQYLKDHTEEAVKVKLERAA